ncbi:MAG: signal transduction histidine kinase [Edaphobacter sp.]|nr:signal transduction histidine kinase [Edaphobacter sp.]
MNCKPRALLKEHLGAQEALREDYQSANEEMLSANEELQSTNEELETSKEELQATNEELNTVNDELNSNNATLRLLGNDLKNLLESTVIPIVMVDTRSRSSRIVRSLFRSSGRIAANTEPTKATWMRQRNFRVSEFWAVDAQSEPYTPFADPHRPEGAEVRS